jgi:hypothetical protein
MKPVFDCRFYNSASLLLNLPAFLETLNREGRDSLRSFGFLPFRCFVLPKPAVEGVLPQACPAPAGMLDRSPADVVLRWEDAHEKVNRSLPFALSPLQKDLPDL